MNPRVKRGRAALQATSSAAKIRKSPPGADPGTLDRAPPGPVGAGEEGEGEDPAAPGRLAEAAANDWKEDSARNDDSAKVVSGAAECRDSPVPRPG